MVKNTLKKIILFIRNSHKDHIKLKSYVPKGTKIEEYLVIEKRCYISDLVKFIGKGTYINESSYIDRCEYIGRYCSIGREVKIGLGSHPIDRVSTNPLFYNKNRGLVNFSTYDNKKLDKGVYIGNDVWIGSGAIIMKNIKVGNGAIIGAGAVVTKDIPDYAIVGGVPASIIKYRFDSETIDRLIKSEWWNIKIDSLKGNINLLNNPKDFLGNLDSFDYE